MHSPDINVSALLAESAALASAGRGREARALAEQAEGIARIGADTASLARACYLIGASCRLLSEEAKALRYLDEAEDIYTRLEDAAALARLHLQRGLIAMDHGDLAGAIDAFMLGLDRSHDEPLRSRLLTRLGVVSLRVGDLAHAEDYLKEALAVADRVGDERLSVNPLFRLGLVYLGKMEHSGETASRKEALHRRARESLDLALARARASGRLRLEALIIDARAVLHRDARELEQAIACSQTAIEMLARLPSPRDLAEVRLNLARSHFTSGNVATAIAEAESSLHTSLEFGFPLSERDARALLSDCEAASGRYRVALEHLRACRRIEQRLRADAVARRIDRYEHQRELTQLNAEKAVVERRLEATYQLSVTDPLTGLLNRRGIESRFLSLKNGLSHGVALVIDVDHFKKINDACGHATGDRVLRRVSEILVENSRSSDLIGRWGGEEFFILCENTSLRKGMQVAERLRVAVESTDWSQLGCKLPVTISMGAVAFVGTADLQAAFERADRALYEAKIQGRNRIILHDASRTEPPTDSSTQNSATGANHGAGSDKA